MKKYEVEFIVDRTRTKQIVNAKSQSDVKELIKAQYPMSKVEIRYVKSLD